jgi:hypothetical protein
MRNVTAEPLVMPALTVPHVCTVMREALAVFVTKENPPVVPTVQPLRKIALQQAANAVQKQKKEQDVPVIKGPEVIAGSMAGSLHRYITTILLL